MKKTGFEIKKIPPVGASGIREISNKKVSEKVVNLTEYCNGLLQKEFVNQSDLIDLIQFAKEI